MLHLQTFEIFVYWGQKVWEACGYQRFPQQGSSVLFYVFFNFQFRCFFKPSPWLSFCSGVWVSGFLVTKDTCHQAVSLPLPLQVLALAWAKFDLLLLLLLAKTGCRVTNILDCGSPGNFSQQRKMSCVRAKSCLELETELNRTCWSFFHKFLIKLLFSWYTFCDLFGT